jgi:hypothetical protein
MTTGRGIDAAVRRAVREAAGKSQKPKRRRTPTPKPAATKRARKRKAA